MNVTKMLEVANIIENASPDKFHMGAWFGQLVPFETTDAYASLDYYEMEELEEVGIPEMSIENISTYEMLDIVDSELKTLTCNTTACIAGWTIANEFMNCENYKSEWLSNPHSYASIEESAMNLLGITYQEAHRLFYINESSIWVDVAEDYNLPITDLYINNTELWNIHPKVAADVLRRIALGELEL